MPMTPGPWKAYPNGRVEVPGKGTLCTVANPWNDRAEREANTKAIAAVPAMVEALVQYRDDLKFPPEGDSRDRRLERAEAVLREAGVEL